MTAIFILVLATIAATALATSSVISLRRSENLAESEQATWYAEGIESWVKSLLAKQAQSSQFDSLGDAWAQPVAGLPVDLGQATGRIEDLQGRFNLNNLGALNPQPYYDQLQRLLENIPGADLASASQLGPAIREWLGGSLSPSMLMSSAGGDALYLGLDPSYRSAHQLMKSPSELLAIQGVTPKLYEALRPYVATLPTTSAKINVNTALPPVLLSLSGKPGAGVQSFIQERVKDPLQNGGDAVKRGLLEQDPTAASLIDVRSNYFELQAEITVGSARTLFFSTIYRPAGGGAPIVIAHSMGTD